MPVARRGPLPRGLPSPVMLSRLVKIFEPVKAPVALHSACANFKWLPMQSGRIHGLGARLRRFEEIDMRLAITAVALASMSAQAIAHPEGHGEYPMPAALPVTALAQQAVARLVTEDKLPASWTKAKLLGRELRTKDGVLQWVVIFQNEAERKRTRRMLYVLMSQSGSFISADHELT
jgi:hypothetical protein